jgi:hypothetical protein
MAAEAVAQQFDKQVVVLSYHYYPPLTVVGYPEKGDLNRTLRGLLHIGAQNPTGRDTTKLCDWWINGSCTFMPLFAGFDRWGALAVYDQALPQLESQLAKPTPVRIKLDAKWSGDRVVSNVTANGLSATGNPLKVHVVLVEDSIFIPGGNAPIQNHLVRFMAGDSTTGFGYAVPAGKGSHAVRETFDITGLESIFHEKRVKHGVMEGDPSTWSNRVDHFDRSQLWVVAYVQDQTTGEVLQAIQVKVPPVRGVTGTR